MKRLVLAVAVIAMAVLAATPVASAHTGSATITCDSVTFSFEQFKDPTTVIHELVRIDGVLVESTDFTLTGASGSNTIQIDVPAGTHTVVARAEWSDTEGGGFFRVVQVVSGCEEPGGGCTLTKGFYRNHPDDTASIIAGMGGVLTVGNRALDAATVQEILDATPGDPGDVRFPYNLFLNLAQQLIAAELNLASTATAPESVTEAISQANAGIRVRLLDDGTIRLRTETLSRATVSDLVETLSAFNEGEFDGVPHCD
jgi:hypothetical protein